MSRPVLVSIVLAFLTVATFLGVKNNGFVSYDDPDYLTSNAIVQKGISKEGLAWAFGKVHGEQTYWHPLTWVSHMLDVQLFGMNPGAHHLVSLGFHTLNVLLLFLALNSMTGALWRSALVAALFAVHPLQVESVAWATERKNVLSGVFFMLTLWLYARYAKNPGIGRYLLAFSAFAVGLMCKPALVPLPGLLLLLDYWPLCRFNPFAKATSNKKPEVVATKRIILEKLPFVALAIGSALLTLSAHKGLGMLEQAAAPNSYLKWGNIIVSYARYPGKTLWPTDLAVFYPFPKGIGTNVVLGCLVVVVAITAFVLMQSKRRPYLTIGWFWFVGMLVPAIGIVPVGIQAMADRFSYLAVIGVFVGVVWRTSEILENRKAPSQLRYAIALIPIAVLAALTLRQVSYWKDDYALFEHARTATRDNYMANAVVGTVLVREGKIGEAMHYFEMARSINPNFADTYYSVGVAMYKSGNMPAAISNFEQAVKLRPIYPEARMNLGLALQTAGRLEESVENYKIVLQTRPDSAEAHLGIGNALLTASQHPEAIVHFREAIRLNPRASGAMARLAWILATHSDAKVRNGSEALRLAEEACRLTKYQHIQMVNTLAAAYAETGNFDLAVRTADQAIALAKSEGATNLVPVIENLRDRYARREPYRE